MVYIKRQLWHMLALEQVSMRTKLVSITPSAWCSCFENEIPICENPDPLQPWQISISGQLYATWTYLLQLKHMMCLVASSVLSIGSSSSSYFWTPFCENITVGLSPWFLLVQPLSSLSKIVLNFEPLGHIFPR